MFFESLFMIAIEIMAGICFFSLFAAKREDGWKSRGKAGIFLGLTVTAAYFLQDDKAGKALVLFFLWAVMMFWYFQMSLLKAAALTAVYQILLYLLDYATYMVCVSYTGSVMETEYIGLISKMLLILCVLLLYRNMRGVSSFEFGKPAFFYLLLF